MLSITSVHHFARTMHTKGDNTYLESQQIRLKSLEYYKNAGMYLNSIREAFDKEERKDGLIETDMGNFKSFNDYLKQTGWVRSTVYGYIKLYENWDVVEKLGILQPTEEALDKVYRITRTLKVISWYNDMLASGVDESLLTIENYWTWYESGRLAKQSDKNLSEQTKLTYKELLKENETLRAKLSALEQEVNTLKARLRVPVVA